MSTVRARRAANPSTGASASAAGVATQDPSFNASFRAPRAQGLVGVGVGDRGGIQNPQSYAVGGPNTGLIDFSSVFTWRCILAGIALLYIVGFHVTLPLVGRIRL